MHVASAFKTNAKNSLSDCIIITKTRYIVQIYISCIQYLKSKPTEVSLNDFK